MRSRCASGMIYGREPAAATTFLSMAAYEANFANQFDMQIFIKKAPGVDNGHGACGGGRLRPSSTRVPRCSTRRATRRNRPNPSNQMLALVYALLALAILIALLGIGKHAGALDLRAHP